MIVGGSVAVLVVRDGQLPTGAEECVAEAGGQAFLVGDGLDEALEELDGCLQEVWTLEWSGPWSPPDVAAVLIPSLRPADVVVTPATPSSATKRARWPSSSRVRERLSSQICWPCWRTWSSGFIVLPGVSWKRGPGRGVSVRGGGKRGFCLESVAMCRFMLSGSQTISDRRLVAGDAHGVFLPGLRNSLRLDSPRPFRNTPRVPGG